MKILSSQIRHIGVSVVAFAFLLAAGGCGSTNQSTEQQSQQNQAETQPITVVASINQWGSLAKQIGGDHVNVTSLITSTNQDPHDFEPQTSDIASLQQAQVVVSNGAGYDHWASDSLPENVTSVSAAQTIGASQGDNPHLWFSKDARNAMAKELTDVFSKIQPDNAKYFKNRYDEFSQQESQLASNMEAFSKTHKPNTYAASESVAYYLMNDIGLKDVTPQGYAKASANESEPAPQDLQQFQQLLADKGTSLFVHNTQSSSPTSDLLLKEAKKSDIAVFDISEQMPQTYSTLSDWIASLVEQLTILLPENDSNENNQEDSQSDTTPSNEGQTDPLAPSNEGQEDPEK